MKVSNKEFNNKPFAKGAFTKVYKFLDSRYVMLKSSCVAKECAALGWGFDSTFFAPIKRVDEETYIMKYYPRVTSLKKSLKPLHYKLYKELRGLSQNSGRDNDSFDHWHKQFDKVSNKRLREALKEALDGLGNYGTDIAFEISPRNVAVNKGCLVLLDCFFSIGKLREIRGL